MALTDSPITPQPTLQPVASAAFLDGADAVMLYRKPRWRNTPSRPFATMVRILEAAENHSAPAPQPRTTH
jgi:hypothetical protein